MRELLDFGWLAGVGGDVGVAIVVGLYLLMLVWIMTRRRARICGDEGQRAPRWHDLRLWIALLIAIQIGLHMVLR